jgi:hypothetical protein
VKGISELISREYERVIESQLKRMVLYGSSLPTDAFKWSVRNDPTIWGEQQEGTTMNDNYVGQELRVNGGKFVVDEIYKNGNLRGHYTGHSDWGQETWGPCQFELWTEDSSLDSDPPSTLAPIAHLLPDVYGRKEHAERMRREAEQQAQREADKVNAVGVQLSAIMDRHCGELRMEDDRIETEECSFTIEPTENEWVITTVDEGVVWTPERGWIK